MRLQETAVVRDKIENLVIRIATLEARFETPPEDVTEQRRRRELIQYAILPPLYLVLSSFQ